VNQRLTIVAIIRARAGREAEVGRRLRGLVEPSRRDPGCLNYDLHVSLETPGLFLFYENWATRADWDAHMATPHLAAWKAAAEDLVESTEILQMQPEG
jgi:quinol monooxygenase YgiN